MADFQLTSDGLQRLALLNQLDLPGNNELIFIGLRGAMMSRPMEQGFAISQSFSTSDINYVNPRCTLLQWKRREGTIAAFPASTVPHVRNIKVAQTRNGMGTNCLMTGYYTDYVKGMHKAGSPSGHTAFRQNALHPILRSADDLDYDSDDRVEYQNPQDNIHCGWFHSLDSDSFASAGCQVIMGYPKCAKPGRETNTGPWKIFHQNAYNSSQEKFAYLLLTASEVMNAVARPAIPTSVTLRFGSTGALVKELQTALKVKNLYSGIIDGDYGQQTMRAVIAFQSTQFGRENTTGVADQVTAEELGITLPKL